MFTFTEKISTHNALILISQKQKLFQNSQTKLFKNEQNNSTSSIYTLSTNNILAFNIKSNVKQNKNFQLTISHVDQSCN